MRRAGVVLGAFLASFIARDAHAQATAADSMRVARDARRAQERFERVRRAHLPQEQGRSGGSCDLRVGRLCYWYEDDSLPPGYREAGDVVEARRRLLRVLAVAGSRVPADAWILGQRVRYLVEAGESDSALAVLQNCRSGTWRCAALRGLVLHVAQRFASSDSAFRDALLAMPPRQACAWNDISLLLEGAVRRRYERMSCALRAEIDARFWFLARPLLGAPANDLRTEWLSRRVMATLLAPARLPHEMAWGSDLEELLLRFGWETWWSRAPATSAMAAPAWTTIGHTRTPAFAFAPRARLLEDPDSLARADDWDLSPRVSGFRYAPLYARSFVASDFQVATFRRGDSALVVAAYDVSGDSLLRSARVSAALVLKASPGAPVYVARTDTRRGVLSVRAPLSPTLLALEVSAPGVDHVARARTGLAPPSHSGRVSISDMLLYAPAELSQPQLADVIPHALPSTTLTNGRVGVFWETYGLRAEGEPVRVVLTVERTGTSLIRRGAEALGLAERATPLSVQWQELPDSRTGVASRGIVIDLSAMAAGSYRLSLVAVAAAADSASSSRVITIHR